MTQPQTDKMREWAEAGARVRIAAIQNELALIYETFPYLREQPPAQQPEAAASTEPNGKARQKRTRKAWKSRPNLTADRKATKKIGPTISAAGRRRISAAQQRRWAAVRAAKIAKKPRISFDNATGPEPFIGRPTK